MSNLFLVFLPQKAACDIQELSIRFEKFYRSTDNLLLQNDILFDPVFTELQLDIWISPQCPCPSARCIYYHPIYFSSDYFIQRLFIAMKLHVCYSCSIEPPFSLT